MVAGEVWVAGVEVTVVVSVAVTVVAGEVWVAGVTVSVEVEVEVEVTVVAGEVWVAGVEVRRKAAEFFGLILAVSVG